MYASFFHVFLDFVHLSQSNIESSRILYHFLYSCSPTIGLGLQRDWFCRPIRTICDTSGLLMVQIFCGLSKPTEDIKKEIVSSSSSFPSCPQNHLKCHHQPTHTTISVQTSHFKNLSRYILATFCPRTKTIQ